MVGFFAGIKNIKKFVVPLVFGILCATIGSIDAARGGGGGRGGGARGGSSAGAARSGGRSGASVGAARAGAHAGARGGVRSGGKIGGRTTVAGSGKKVSGVHRPGTKPGIKPGAKPGGRPGKPGLKPQPGRPGRPGVPGHARPGRPGGRGVGNARFGHHHHPHGWNRNWHWWGGRYINGLWWPGVWLAPWDTGWAEAEPFGPEFEEVVVERPSCYSCRDSRDCPDYAPYCDEIGCCAAVAV